MTITSVFSMSRSTKGAPVYVTYEGKTTVFEPTNSHYNEAVSIYNTLRAAGPTGREYKVTTYPNTYAPDWLIGKETSEQNDTAPAEKSKEDILLEGLTSLIDFFNEFDFTPSYRFTNTLAYKINANKTQAKDFVNSYFSLMASSYAEDIQEKIKSKEFDALLTKIKQYGTPANHVNNRMKVYYGAAGTGKTTVAWQESDGRCIQCNASMLPSDLMENFIFKDGKPDFDKSLLWECMEQGKPILLDEINLLPFDSLRFLQGIADGKTSFTYKNREVHIKDGFKIIGTMNLTLGGVTYGLPEPLVDRCEDIREFVLDAKQLMGSITGNFVAG